MGIDTTESIGQIFDRWQREDRDIKSSIAEIRQWMREIELFGIPHFGEAATRLRSLHERMVRHFKSEHEMLVELSLKHPTSRLKIEELNRDASDDHNRLLDLLDDLMERLNQLEPPFESWQRAWKEFEHVVTAIEAHEASESECIAELIPTENASQKLLD